MRPLVAAQRRTAGLADYPRDSAPVAVPARNLNELAQRLAHNARSPQGTGWEPLSPTPSARRPFGDRRAGWPRQLPNADLTYGALATTCSSTGTAARLTCRGIAAFYYPLALTSVIGLATYPMLTFFMGRAHAPLESLAVFPVVGSLSFIFRAVGLSYQEAAIALLGDDLEHRRAVGRFAVGLALACALGQAVFAVDPFFGHWFVTVSGLAPELAAYASVPVMLLVPLPGLSVWLSYQRAANVLRRRTRLLTEATIVEIAGIAGIFAVAGWGLGLAGVTAASAALLGGRLLSNLYLEFLGEGSPRNRKGSRAWT